MSNDGEITVEVSAEGTEDAAGDLRDGGPEPKRAGEVHLRRIACRHRVDRPAKGVDALRRVADQQSHGGLRLEERQHDRREVLRLVDQQQLARHRPAAQCERLEVVVVIEGGGILGIEDAVPSPRRAPR